jgi:hypothetical protein
MPATRLAVPRRVKVPAAQGFGVVSDPSMHIEIDGSGMLKLAPDAGPLQAVGDSFDMHMDREPLGDLPMGKYTVTNTVTKLVPDSLIEWNVATEDRGMVGHVYGWEVTEVGAGQTDVTNYCDWSQIPEAGHHRFPIVPREMMERSVDNLVALVTDAPTLED